MRPIPASSLPPPALGPDDIVGVFGGAATFEPAMAEDVASDVGTNVLRSADDAQAPAASASAMQERSADKRFIVSSTVVTPLKWVNSRRGAFQRWSTRAVQSIQPISFPRP